MTPLRLFCLTFLALTAFAGNSLLCRLALTQTSLDPASFTLIRLLSGALVLALILRFRSTSHRRPRGQWLSALALFIYAAAFSFAYLTLSAGTGALLLFGAVQATMIFWGLRRGERFSAPQLLGLALALAGLIALVLPGLSAPSFSGSFFMISAGVAWGIYSLRGKTAGDPAAATAGNFLRATPFAVLLSLAAWPWFHFDGVGVFYAILSGAFASGLGYVIWYTALPSLDATRAATVQLSVPVLAAAGGILLLGEPITLRFLSASLLVLGGIALVVLGRKRPRPI